MSKARDIADLDFNSPDIDGGNIDGATIGGTTPAAGSFTTGQFNTSINVDGVAKVDALTVNAGTGTDAVAKLRMGTGNSGVNKSSIKFENSAGSSIFSFDYDNSTTNFDINSDIAGNIMSIARSGSIIFNQDSADQDFRVESNSNTHMLFVDGGNDTVVVGSGTISAPSNYDFLSYNASSSGRSAFVHGAGDGGIVVSGAAGGSAASVIFGNNWGTNGATFLEEYRLYMDGADDSLNFNYNANANTAIKLTNDGRTNIYGVGSEAASRFTVNNDGSSTGHLQFQTAMNDQQNGYVRANMVMARNKDTLIWDPTDETWDYTAGSSADWSMISKTSGSLNFHIGASEASHWSLSNTAFNTAYLMYNMTPTGGHTWEAPGGGGFVFNNNGLDRDFRVESNNNANILFVDASADTVNIGNTTDFGGILNVNGGLNSKQAVFTSTNNRGLALSTASRSGQNDGVAIIDAQDTESTGGRLELHTMGSVRASFERDQIIFNEGSNDQDFRVESNGRTSMLFVDGGNNAVGIGTNVTGNSTLEVLSTGVDGTFANAIGFQYSGNSNEANTISTAVSSNASLSGMKFNISDGGGSSGKTNVATFLRNQIIFNDDSNDQDFRVESNNNTHMLFVDGGTNSVGIGTSSPDSSYSLNVSGAGNERIVVDSTNNTTSGMYMRVFSNGVLQGNSTLRVNNVGSLQAYMGSSSSSEGKYLEYIVADGVGNGTARFRGNIGLSHHTSDISNYMIAVGSDNSYRSGVAFLLKTSQAQWESGYIKIKTAAGRTGLQGHIAAEYLYRFQVYNESISGIGLASSSGDTGSFTVSVTSQNPVSNTETVELKIRTSASTAYGTHVISGECHFYGGIYKARREI